MHCLTFAISPGVILFFWGRYINPRMVEFEWLEDTCRTRAADGTFIARVLVDLRFLCESTTALAGRHVMIEYAPSTPSGIEWTAFGPRPAAR